MIETMTPLPWQTTQWNFITNRKPVVQAVLLSGASNVGKMHFARAYVYFLLCAHKKDNKACGQCSVCHLLQAETHSDVQFIEGEGASGMIKVDRMREVIEWAQGSPRLGASKVIIIKDAEKMNPASSNALLKTLEEPPLSTYFILVSSYSALLPATIRSRCQNLHFPSVYSEEAIAWLESSITHPCDAKQLLQSAGGAPLLALAQSGSDETVFRKSFFDTVVAVVAHKADPVCAAGELQKKCLARYVELLATFTLDIVQAQLRPQHVRVFHPDVMEALQTFVSRISLQGLYRFYDTLLTLKRDIIAGAPVNEQLCLEDLMITLKGLTS